MQFLAIALVTLAISSLGFIKYVYFISIGYGFSIAGIGAALLILFNKTLTPGTTTACILFIVYGLRLGGYLTYRELKSSSYGKHMKNEVKSGDGMKLVAKIGLWVTCALLYICETTPVFFRLLNGKADDALIWIGAFIMLLGIIVETTADVQKSLAKRVNPKRFCDTGLYKIVRCPNYLGEMLFWAGVLISGLTALKGVLQWTLALVGNIGIMYVMFSGARRLEIRQNKNYGKDPEYQAYVKKTPIMIPFVPLYSVEKYKFLVG